MYDSICSSRFSVYVYALLIIIIPVYGDVQKVNGVVVFQCVLKLQVRMNMISVLCNLLAHDFC
jgi:hypothetical protein